MCLQLGNIGQVAAGCLTKFGTAAQTFDKGVEKLNHQISTSGLRDPSQPDAISGSTFTIQQNVKNSLEPQYRALVKTLDKDAGDTANLLRHPHDVETVRALIDGGFIPLANASQWPGLTLTDQDRAKYYTATMKNMSPADRAKYLIDHKEISPTVLDLILSKDRATAREIGKVVKEKASTIDHDTDESDVKAVVDLLARFKDSKEASAGIIHEMGAGGLISAISIAGGRLYAGKGDDQTNLHLGQYIRDVFRSGEPTLAGYDPDASRTLAKDMVDWLRKSDPDHQSEQSGNDQYALSYLLKDSTLSTPFLDTMGDELDYFERHDMAQSNSTWSRMGDMQYGGSWFFDDDDRDAAYDPVASYMSALGKNDEASLQFFSGGGENPHGATGDERQDYWIGHRYWGHDDFDGLTSALDSATTGAHNLDDPASSRQAAGLMSAAAHLLGERSGIDWNTDGEGFNPGDVSTAGSKHVAHMLTTYMAAVDSALETQTRSDDFHPGVTPLTQSRFGPGIANMPTFLGSDLKTLADVAVSTDDGFNDMRQGLTTYQNIQLQNSIHAHGLIDDQTSQADARLEGFYVNAVGDTKIADAEKTDARVQSWIDMGKDVVGEIPVPGGKVVEFLASHAIDAGADQLSDHYANNEDAQVDKDNNYAGAALDGRHEAAQNALVNAGVIKPDDVAHEVTSVPNSGYTKAQVEGWFPDGKFPTQEQYNAMSTDDRSALRNALMTIVGDRKLNDIPNYDHTYKDMFSSYFEKGDGDGN